MSVPSIKVNDASLIYDQKILFSGLDLTIPSGQWTCVLGPSGVGKTSLLRLIAGLTSAAKVSNPIKTSDNISLAGRIAYLAQNDQLLPWLNVMDNILIGYRLRSIRIKNLSVLKKKAQLLLAKVGLAHACYAMPITLSGGMRQRVLPARTLMEDKPVILMDEPFGALDVITRIYLQELTTSLLADKTVVLVTHDPLEALRLGHHIIILSGSPATITEIKLPHSPPRELSDPSVLQWQAQILQTLSHAKEILEC